MVVLLIIAGLGVLLTVACIREARSGRPAWGSHTAQSPTTCMQASKEAKAAVVATIGIGAFLGMGGDS